MRTFKSHLFILFMFVGGLAFSQVTDTNQQANTTNTQTTSNFGDFDTNADSSVDRSEFNQRYSQDYAQWDVNQDDNIDRREFHDYTYNRLDTDRDRNLSQQEWESGYDNIYGDYLGDRDFNRYDLDRNQRISNEEFDRSMRDTYYYSDYDTNRDMRIDRDELNEGVFSRMDRNQDGTLDSNEYEQSSTYYTHGSSTTTNRIEGY